MELRDRVVRRARVDQHRPEERQVRRATVSGWKRWRGEQGRGDISLRGRRATAETLVKEGGLRCWVRLPRADPDEARGSATDRSGTARIDTW